MLAKLTSLISENCKITLNKTVGGKDASLFGAFSRTDVLTFSLHIPRLLGITVPCIRLAQDGGEVKERKFEYIKTELGCDVFELTISLSSICENQVSGLFYYDFVFPCGKEVLFSCTEDNVNITLSKNEGKKFRLLVYEEGFDTPKWFRGGIMYHIFVDRFAKGSYLPLCRPDAEMNDDWENGIPQYGEYPGAFVKNNVFFGGNLIGIREKLDYLSSLGVTVIYLSPIFKSYSNHKYDTGDYMQVDEMFGGEEALKALIEAAAEKGIKIILDGVFNHTGDDSLYFNKYGKYDSLGAYQSEQSPYYKWYTFENHPDKYLSWWGIPILPKLNLENPECRDFLVKGEKSVVGKYTKMGIGGIRLDVADELNDTFLDTLRSTAKELSGDDAIIIGEVWENAADKISYGKRRRYFQGAQLDSVMNYPLRTAIIDFLLSGDAHGLSKTLIEIYSSYPKCVCDCLMNILGTHDTERILTVLGGEQSNGRPNCELAYMKMSEETKDRAIKLLKLGSIIQYTVYGVPSVFYGDEAGLEGYHDPFCRMPFPWGRESKELLEHYKLLGNIRRKNTIFAEGLFKITKAEGAYIEYQRELEGKIVTVAVNASNKELFPALCGLDMLSGKKINEKTPIAPHTAFILKNG
ncbi:MAG: glycoside hydrolase family 13 protein [Clostridia bacterium]|nr:glycoside hydrolase family 13 protein [Clostridia bacterium]